MLSILSDQIRWDQLLSRVWLSVTPWIAARQASLSITNSWSSLRLTSIESMMPSSHFILCRPLLLLPPIPLSIRVFSNESTLRMRWPKYWSFSFSIILSKEIPELISFRMDLLDLLAVQGTLKSLLQHHSSKTSILQHSAFFTVQLSHPYHSLQLFLSLQRTNDIDWLILSKYVCWKPAQDYGIRRLEIYRWLDHEGTSLLKRISALIKKVELLSLVWLFETPWTVACQAPPSMEFSRKEYWSGLLFPSPGYLPNPGIKPRSPAFQEDSLPSEPPRKYILIKEISNLFYHVKTL